MQQGKTAHRAGWIGALGLSAAIGLGALPAWADPEARAGAPKDVAQTSVRWNDSAGMMAPPRPDLLERRWYGWQILIPTLASDSMLVAALFSGPSLPLFIAGASGHALSGPIVHLAHGHPGKAAGSFLLTAGLPAVPAALIFTSQCYLGHAGGGGGCGPLLAGILTLPIGIVVGAAIDSTVLAEEDVPAKTMDKLPVTGLSLAPLVVSPLRRAEARREQPMPLGLSLAGQF